MTGQLQDPAWQQQQPDDVTDGHEVECSGCGLSFYLIERPAPHEYWFCPDCEGVEANR